MSRTIHTFDSTREAYDACQCDPAIADGDTLSIPSDRANNDYLGKIVGGKFHGHYISNEMTAAVAAACANPVEQAIEYGRMTGACSCCNRELTNPESIERGIGPVCAKKYGW